MHRIEIIHNGIELSSAKVAYLADRGIVVTPVLASWFSAFTAMSVAREVDRLSAAEVLVTRLKDAFAAISARRVAKTRFRIIYEVAPNSAVPRGIPADVREQVDCWLFPSTRLRDAYPAGLRGVEVVPTICYDKVIASLPLPHPTPTRHLLWLGPIDGNVERLKRAIDHVGDGVEDASLRIIGTGKARYAMEAVRRSRAVAHPQRIVWLGDDADLVNEALNATHVVQSGLDPIAEELALVASGRPLITFNE